MHRPGPKAFCLVLLGAWLASLHSFGADVPAQPTAAELRRQANRCRELLRKSVLNFYLPKCVDPINGGYLEDWRDGRFVARGERFLTMQARQLWFFSTMAAENIERQRCLEAALLGYQFLDLYFRDARHGGYISKTDDLGQPVDTRKHLYHNSFAIYAFVAYFQATKGQAALQRAQEIFRAIDQHAYDAQHGGYHEFFHADWRPVTNPSESGYVGAIGTKTYNTHLHLLESFTALHQVWPDPRLRYRLEELIRINTLTVQHPAHRFNIDGWHPNWLMVNTPGNLRASYGHDVECIWLTLEALRSLRTPVFLYRSWAEGLAEYSLKFGYDNEHGGFFYTGPPGAPASDRRKEWWVQAEALVGMLEMYQLTGDIRYYNAFARTLDFIERHQVAPDGGWFATRNEDGSATGNQSRSSMWQGAYHSGRALLLSAKILSTLKPVTN